MWRPLQGDHTLAYPRCVAEPSIGEKDCDAVEKWQMQQIVEERHTAEDSEMLQEPIRLAIQKGDED